MDAPQVTQASALNATNGAPLWLLAELTYRCPLHCVFCYNPVEFALTERELATDDWIRVLREARALGSVQCGFSGGERTIQCQRPRVRVRTQQPAIATVRRMPGSAPAD